MLAEHNKKVNVAKPVVIKRKPGPPSPPSAKAAKTDSGHDLKPKAEPLDDIEAMLIQHNAKILAQNAKYDTNGRKIVRVAPTVCPPPPTSSEVNQSVDFFFGLAHLCTCY